MSAVVAVTPSTPSPAPFQPFRRRALFSPAARLALFFAWSQLSDAAFDRLQNERVDGGGGGGPANFVSLYAVVLTGRGTVLSSLTSAVKILK
jgi:hypothetical protein